MKLIVGLGNPGSEYAKTRHNVGYMAVDRFASKINANFKLNNKFKGEIAEVISGTDKVILLKPTTYMNLSGEAIRAVMNFYKIDLKDFIVVYDDMDMDVGKIRLRQTGSAGGHNGIKSTIANLSTENFYRVKIGISKDVNHDAVKHVLGKFSEDDMAILNGSFEHVEELLREFIESKSFEYLMNKYNCR